MDIGVPVFLPASQVDIRRPGEISDWIGRNIDAMILKIDEERRNIVISRRKLIEQQAQEELKKKTFEGLNVGEVRKGTVKNIADFGAFIDLGGIDGLLHITDMSWGRVNHPTDMLKIDQEIEVKVLSIDKDKEKIALGLKQKDASPWENIELKYPVGSVHDANVVNIMSYGAFCKLEEGVEGLVHISEMSWTKRINHPSEVVTAQQKVQVKVLEINKDKQEISLGMKQVEENPWERVAEKYPPGSVVSGKVRNIANYGVFVEIEEGIDGLLHVSDLSWTKKIGHPSEMLKKGEKEVHAVVLSASTRKNSASRWVSSRCRKTPGRPSSRPTTARAWSSKATSPRSPTSASSSNSNRVSKVFCTSARSPTRRLTSPKKPSRSARKSTSRFCESIPTNAKSDSPSSALSGRTGRREAPKNSAPERHQSQGPQGRSGRWRTNHRPRRPQTRLISDIVRYHFTD